jgi:NADH dehydrogenase FAD-containing subunit
MTRIVVLGGGFGGIEAVTRLERRLGRRPDVELWLVSDHNFLLFSPRLPQVASSRSGFAATGSSTSTWTPVACISPRGTSRTTGS